MSVVLKGCGEKDRDEREDERGREEETGWNPRRTIAASRRRSSPRRGMGSTSWLIETASRLLTTLNSR